MKILILIFLTIFLGAANYSQQPDLSELSGTEGGRRVLEYFRAFNSADEEKLKTFFLENLTASSLKERPAEPRVEFHRRIRDDFQTLEIRKLISSAIRDELEIAVLVQGRTGQWAEYKFMIEKQSPQRLISWGIELTEPPDEADETKYESPKNTTELISTIRRYLDDQSAADKFSGVVLVAKDDSPIFQGAYGFSDKESRRPNDLETKFNLGSINKIFTRIAIGRLVSEGKVSFDDKLGKFLPEYPNKAAADKVTIRHLVTMKSGIGDIFGKKYESTPKNTLRKISDYLPLFADQPLAFEPGTKQQYSNGGYIVLGAIIEKVTGQTYYDYVRENIFKVAGMTQTDSFETDKTPANTANGYFKRNNIWTDNVDTRPYRGSSAGGGYSTATDLLKFSVAVKTGKLAIPDDDGAPRNDGNLGIAGGSVGINTMLLVNKRTGYTVIVLSNYDPPSAEKVGGQIRNWLREIKD